jgi:hypothetical protein
MFNLKSKICTTVFISYTSLCGQEVDINPSNAPLAPEPFSFSKRLKWASRSAVGPSRLAGYAIASAISTAGNAPPEYGPHWDGYAKRVGLRLSTGATGLMMEATVGTLWGEDPRYVRAEGRPVRRRIVNILQQVVLAHDRNGKLVPAYARYIAIPSNSFLTNAWRPDSHATTTRALNRIELSFVDRLIANSFSEFWPDIKKAIRRK